MKRSWRLRVGRKLSVRSAPLGLLGGGVIARGAGGAGLSVLVARVAGEDVVGIHQVLGLGVGEGDDVVPRADDVLPVDLEEAEGEGGAVGPQGALEPDFLGHACDGSDRHAVVSAGVLEPERLGVDRVEVDVLIERHGESAGVGGLGLA